MHVDYIIEGTFPVPEGTTPVAGVANQFRLPSGEIISVHPIIEMASGLHTDDHRDLSYSQAANYGIALNLYERSSNLVPDD